MSRPSLLPHIQAYLLHPHQLWCTEKFEYRKKSKIIAERTPPQSDDGRFVERKKRWRAKVAYWRILDFIFHDFPGSVWTLPLWVWRVWTDENFCRQFAVRQWENVTGRLNRLRQTRKELRLPNHCLQQDAHAHLYMSEEQPSKHSAVFTPLH